MDTVYITAEQNNIHPVHFIDLKVITGFLMAYKTWMRTSLLSDRKTEKHQKS